MTGRKRSGAVFGPGRRIADDRVAGRQVRGCEIVAEEVVYVSFGRGSGSAEAKLLTVRMRKAQRLSTDFMTYSVAPRAFEAPVREAAGLTSSTRLSQSVAERVERAGKSSSESAAARKRLVGPIAPTQRY